MTSFGDRFPTRRLWQDRCHVTKRVLGILTLLVVVVPVVFVLEEALRTLATLDRVERERDSWQRPDEILRQLDLHPGMTVVDLGSGAGYFALKIAARVVPDGRVFAVDLRRQSLAFLWVRARIDGHRNLHIIRGRVDDPRLPTAPVDAVLIANTYHELTAPEQMLKALYTAMRPGGRLVVVDRAARTGVEPRDAADGHHEMPRVVAERQINQQGFETVLREDAFIDRSGDEDVWWLAVFRKTSSVRGASPRTPPHARSRGPANPTPLAWAHSRARSPGSWESVWETSPNYFLSGCCESSARFSSSTLTRGLSKEAELPSFECWHPPSASRPPRRCPAHGLHAEPESQPRRA